VIKKKIQLTIYFYNHRNLQIVI